MVDIATLKEEMTHYYTCINCGKQSRHDEPPLWDEDCPHCHKPIGLPVADETGEYSRYCPASALHDGCATPEPPPCPFALDCIHANRCPARGITITGG